MGLSVVRMRKEARTGPTEDSSGSEQRDASLETGRGIIVASLAMKRLGRSSMDTSRLWSRRDRTLAAKLGRPGLSGRASRLLAFMEERKAVDVGSCDAPSDTERG